MINRLDFDGDIHAKINEIIDHLNKQEPVFSEEYDKVLGDTIKRHLTHYFKGVNEAFKQEPKWKVGDKYWYIFFSDFSNHQTVDSAIITSHSGTESFLKSINSGEDTNIFKTKESAEAALAEIKQIMEKYE